MMRRKIMALLATFCMAIVLFYHSNIVNQYGYPMFNHFVTSHYMDTHSENAVNAIYMFYRYYDTIFEALMLLFSIIAVIYLSIHESGDTYE